ncbi:PQQ-binding-like beta-propeller repeat protein [Halorarius halobius]|uniref:outer membrane protein assembly factor BamB family protein n=1 Tax=Halorarius halobius TaxID=2962671 RepID=UPI0020CF5010|nr:PQQ-binding-like beta-propeller repeat protein [Halorarius halobius]
MPSFTRRGALGALAGTAASLAGCSALGDRSNSLEYRWQTGISESTPVVGTAAGPLVGSRSPFDDRPLVAGLDAATGDVTWSISVSKGRKSPIGVGDGRAYAFSKAETALAVDAETGETVWERSLDRIDAADPGVVQFAPVPFGDRVVLPISGTEDDVPDRLEFLGREGGERLATHELDASLAGAPAVAGDRLVTPTLDGRLHGVDREATADWSREVGAAMPAVAGRSGTAYATSGTERLLAVDAATGEVVWRGRLRNTGFAPPLVTDDRVYVGGADYVLRAFDRASGEQMWQDGLDNAVTHGPMRVGDRLVTLVGGDVRVRGASGTVPFSPTELYVHALDGTRLRSISLRESLEDVNVRWASTANGGLYLGGTFEVVRLASEVVADA